MPTQLDPNDPFVQFEAMDRAHTVQSMLEELLYDHPALDNGKLHLRYIEAQRALGALYEEAARIAL